MILWTVEEQSFLTRPFPMDELKDAIFGMMPNETARPDDFNVELYQHFWDTVKNDLFALVNNFYYNLLDIDRLNYGVITRIPKAVTLIGFRSKDVLPLFLFSLHIRFSQSQTL